MIEYKKNNQGVAAVLTVIIIGAVSLMLARSSAGLGRIDLAMTNDHIMADQAMANAESCVSEALRQIQFNSDFSGGLSLTLNNGDCQAQVSHEVGSYIVKSESQVWSYLKKLELRVNIMDQKLNILEWKLE